MSEIKPCPFCGNKAEYWEDSQYQDRHVIECQYCGANKRSEYGYKGVLRDWNTRYDTKGNEMVDTGTVRYRPRVVATSSDYGTFIIKESSDTFEDVLSASAAASDMVFSFGLSTQIVEV